jgi:hypothetical protein
MKKKTFESPKLENCDYMVAARLCISGNGGGTTGGGTSGGGGGGTPSIWDFIRDLFGGWSWGGGGHGWGHGRH